MKGTAPVYKVVLTLGVILVNCHRVVCQTAECSSQFSADVIFALDSSGSVDPTSFGKMVDFSKRVIQGLPINQGSGFQIGAVSFSDAAWIHIDLNTYSTQAQLLDNFDIPYNEGGSNTSAALEAFRTMFTAVRGDRPEKANIAIVMVDGNSIDPVMTWWQSVRTRQYGIHLIVIGIGAKTTSKSFLLELEGIATGPYRQNVYTLASFDDLDNVDISTNMTSVLCNANDECSSGPCLNEAVCYDSIDTYICGCPPGFTGQVCQIASGRIMDLIFVVEVSNQVDPADFTIILQFIQRIVRQMNIGIEQSRVGVILFGSRAQILMRLDTYSQKFDIMHALAMLEFTFIGGNPDILAAIQLVDQHFQEVPALSTTMERVAFFIVNTASVESEVIDASVSLRLQGIQVFVFTTGMLDLEGSVDFFGMTSQPGTGQLTTLFVAGSSDNILSMASNVTYVLYNEVNWCATAPCENGGVCSNQLLDYTCECPESLTGKHCEKACSRHLDVVFMVDTSRTMGQHFKLAVQFAKELIHGLDFRFEGAKIALVTLGITPTLRFGLDKYSTQQHVLQAFTIPGIGGKTDLVAGLTMVKEQVFVSDRNGVDDVIILITDGKIYQSRTAIDGALQALNDGDNDVEDTTVYVIALGKTVDHDFVKKIHPEYRPVYLREEADLPDAVDSTMANICG